jgi:hypothetical protein
MAVQGRIPPDRLEEGLMAEYALPCLKCGRELRNVFPGDVENQPNDGVVLTTSGNYGSTVFDSLVGDVLEVNICDPCLVEAGEKGRVLTYRRARPVAFENVGIVGRYDIPEPVYLTWNRDLPGSDEGTIHLEDEELDDPPKGITLNFTPAELRKLRDQFNGYTD